MLHMYRMTEKVKLYQVSVQGVGHTQTLVLPSVHNHIAQLSCYIILGLPVRIILNNFKANILVPCVKNKVISQRCLCWLCQ
jgi:hypothetical protein